MLTPVIADKLVLKAKELLEENSSIVLLTHAHPDGDAVGSCLALKNVLEGWGKKVSIVIIDKASESFDFLKGFKDIVIVPQIGKEKTKQIFDEASLICCLDFNETGRIGKYLQELLLASPAKRLIIDHHLEPNIVGEVTISCPELSSTSEILFRLMWQMGVYERTDKDFAEAIYSGIVCDTGNFAYGSNSPELFHIVAELLKKGINKDAIYNRIFREYSTQRMMLMGLLLNKKMKVYLKCHSAVISLTAEEMKRYNHQTGDAEGFANLPLSIKGVMFSVFFREETGKIKVSLRSKGEFDVNKIAREYYHGGGHKNAAGGELYCSMEDALKHFESKLYFYKKEADSALRKEN